jgi:hypothetical protein
MQIILGSDHGDAEPCKKRGPISSASHAHLENKSQFSESLFRPQRAFCRRPREGEAT